MSHVFIHPNISRRKATLPGYNLNEFEENQVTPIMVSNFDFPNRNIDRDGPYLKIIEQPQTKFRFRYKSEMVGTHGQLKAESSDKNKAVFPTVKLCNWNKGLALIRLTLFTAEDNVNERVRHVHELNGKNCNKEGFTGGCEVVVDQENDYTTQFSNLGIIHIAKRDVQNIIFQRKKEDLIAQKRGAQMDLNTENIHHNISPTKLQKLKEDAEEEARKMDLNKVVLRFQAFFFDSQINSYRPITEFVDSDIILNLKNASTGELKIVRISAVSCSCTGGSEVWMLVEKVKKNNVKIKFYELDEDNQEVWSGYGVFKESDVHHQYAIVFRTPPYRYTNIREPVNVKIQLVRHPDNDISESIDFTYLPENLKRPNTFNTNDTLLQKRPKYGDMEAIDLKTSGNLFLGTEVKQPYSPETPNQSPSHMVPSPMTPADSPASQGFYSPPHRTSSHHQPVIIVSNSADEPFIVNFAANGERMNTDFNNGFIPVQVNGTEEMVHSQAMTYNGMDVSSNLLPNPMENLSSYYNPYSNSTPSLSPGYQVPSPGSTGYGSPLGVSPGSISSPNFLDQGILMDDVDNALTQIQQFDAVHKQVIHSKNMLANSEQWDFTDWVNKTDDQIPRDEDIDLLDIISNPKLFAVTKDRSDIQADCVKKKSDCHTGQHAKINEPMTNGKRSTEIDALTSKLSQISIDHHYEPELESGNSSMKMALSAAECLQAYGSTGDVRALLATHHLLLTTPNRFGDNVLHSAVFSGNVAHFNKILKVSTSLSCNIVNQQNNDGQTPLHLAIHADNYEMVKSLLMTPGCSTEIKDLQGNTPLHLAAMAKAESNIMKCIVHHSLSRTKERNVFGKLINQFNFKGQNVLHLSVVHGGIEDLKILIKAGGNIHLCEKTRGANVLHLAAVHGKKEAVQYLVENTDITVNAPMLDGNTALHIAAQSKDVDICNLLIKSKANPMIRNGISKESEVKKNEDADNKEEGETEEEEENVIEELNDNEESTNNSKKGGYTPMDYAEQNQEILVVLQGAMADVV